MGDLRSLLRFDEKLAAEGRRLQKVGGPELRGVAPTVFIVALVVHGAILLLPAVRSSTVTTPSRPVPDYPRVWRLPPALIPPPERPEPAPPEDAVAEAPATAETPAVAASPGLRIAMEPILEPPPEFGMSAIPADIQAVIPNPGPLPPTAELGPPSRMPSMAAEEREPALVQRTDPVYPVAARALREEGLVTLRLSVLPDGSVGGAVVLDCSRMGLGFEVAALEAVRRWKYEPAPLQPGVRRVVVRVQFRMQAERP